MTVSVVIPTFNRADLVVAAINSVLTQSNQDLEIIVVDDGSTDDTEHRLATYSERIIYIRQANAGVNAARNYGLSHARGEYIALLDSDDLWFSFKLDLQVKLLEKYPDVGFVFSDFLIRKESGAEIHAGLSTWHTYRSSWRDVLPHHDQVRIPAGFPHATDAATELDIYRGDIYHASLYEPYVLPSTVLIRRRCMDPDIQLVEHDPTCGDWDFFARLSHRHSALYMDVETAVNRSHEDAVRLTRLPQPLQLRRRLDMINRVWASDPAFYAAHGTEVDAVRHEVSGRLARQQAMAGDIEGARQTIRQQRTLRATRKPGMQDRILALTINLPGASVLLRALVALKRRVGRLRSRSTT